MARSVRARRPSRNGSASPTQRGSSARGGTRTVRGLFYPRAHAQTDAGHLRRADGTTGRDDRARRAARAPCDGRRTAPGGARRPDPGPQSMTALALTLALASVLTPGAPLAPASLRVGVAPLPRPPRALVVCPGSPAGGRPLTDAASPLPLPEVPKPPYLVPICPAPFGLPVTRIANDPGH